MSLIIGNALNLLVILSAYECETGRGSAGSLKYFELLRFRYKQAITVMMSMQRGVVSLERIAYLLNLPDGHEHGLSCLLSGNFTFGVEQALETVDEDELDSWGADLANKTALVQRRYEEMHDDYASREAEAQRVQNERAAHGLKKAKAPTDMTHLVTLVKAQQEKERLEEEE